MAQFKKGQSGNPGGRPKEQGRNLKLFLKLLTKDKLAIIIDKTLELAQRGDAKARQDVFDYGLGKPMQAVDVTTGGEKIGDDGDTRTEILRKLDSIATATGKGSLVEKPDPNSSGNAGT
jgi:hypothetical protein